MTRCRRILRTLAGSAMNLHGAVTAGGPQRALAGLRPAAAALGHRPPRALARRDLVGAARTTTGKRFTCFPAVPGSSPPSCQSGSDAMGQKSSLSDKFVDSPSAGFTVNGGKTGTFTNVHPDGTKVEGTITEEITTPAVVTAVLQEDGSWLVSATGVIQVDYTATITRLDGTTETISRTATITLDGERIIYIRMGRRHFRVDMTTGEMEQYG